MRVVELITILDFLPAIEVVAQNPFNISLKVLNGYGIPHHDLFLAGIRVAENVSGEVTVGDLQEETAYNFSASSFAYGMRSGLTFRTVCTSKFMTLAQSCVESSNSNRRSIKENQQFLNF